TLLFPRGQKTLFLLFLIMYLVTLMGNLLFILAICYDPQLQNPMYFFFFLILFSHSICYTTVIVPKMLVNFLSETKTISYNECLAQMYFFLAFGNMDSYLLASMTIDRYVAICNPFHYVTVMNHRCCVLLLATFTALSYLHSLLHVLLVNQLTFCASNVIHHFFCDVNPILKLACSSMSDNGVVAMTEGLASVMALFGCIVISYLRILIAVLIIPSDAGKHKPSPLQLPSHCGDSVSWEYNFSRVIYTVLTSMLVSLRNTDMKRGLENLISRIKSHIDRLSTAKAKKICGP
uniref:Olfactory receptor n=1 Tax=Sus scrofa TaxID=9823 RepID=A0A287AUD7_PIG